MNITIRIISITDDNDTTPSGLMSAMNASHFALAAALVLLY